MNTAAQTATTTATPIIEVKAGDRVKHFDGIREVLAVHVLSATMVEVTFHDCFTIGAPADCLPVLV